MAVNEHEVEQVTEVLINAETAMLASQEAARLGITLKHYIEALITVALVESLPETPTPAASAE